MIKFLLPLSLFLGATRSAFAACAAEDFCPDGVTQADVVVDPEDADQVTCGTLIGVLAFVPEADCPSLKLGEIRCCPKTMDPICFLCGSADASFDKEKIIDETMTCGSLDEMMQLNPRSESCDAWLGMYSSGYLNVQSYCGCEGAVAPDTCKPCPDGYTVNATAAVPDESGMTCADGAEMFSHLLEEGCNDMTSDATEMEEIQKACCIAPTTSAGVPHSFLFTVVLALVGLVVLG